MFAHRDIERESLSSSRGSEQKPVHQTLTDTPLPKSSAETLEQVIEDDPRKHLDLLVAHYQLGEWKHEIHYVAAHYDKIEPAVHRGGKEGQYSTFSDVHWTWIRRFERRQAVP